MLGLTPSRDINTPRAGPGWKFMLYRFRHNILAVGVILLLVVTVVGVATCTVMWGRLAGNADASFNAAKFGRTLDQLVTSLQAAESGQRTFLLTGDESHLAALNDAEKTIPAQFNEMAGVVAGSAVLQSNLLELRGLAGVKLAALKEGAEMRRTNNLAAATALVGSGKVRETTEAIRILTGRMWEQELKAFAGAGAATARELKNMRAWGLSTGFLGIGAGLFALYLVRVGYLQEKSRAELAEGKLRAEKAAVEKSAFLANISHEIRTPMNAILGFSELLEGEPLGPRQAQYVRSIRQSGKSLLQLVSDVLDLSKLEAGKLELRREPTDMREVCDFLQTLFAQQAATKSLKLEFVVGEAPHALLLDRLRLRQVLVNVIGNAIKFTERGHVRTRIEWSEPPGEHSRGTLAIHVEDTGVGIPPEKQEEIFKPFVQSASSVSGENQGAGLGLNIVQRLTEIMGGTVGLDSEPGTGSIFHLRFPEVVISARLPVGDTAEKTETHDFNDFDAATFLVVDDNETNRQLVAAIFSGSHHRVRLAANGKDALDDISKNKPSVVLMDIRMPEMDGIAVLSAIRNMPGMELLPVIAVTASSQRKDEQSLRHRFNGYIRKPFSQQTLYKELTQFLPRTPRAPAPQVSAEPPRETVAPAGPVRKAPDWDVMVSELRMLHTSEWAGLRESLAINQTQAFARKLQIIAEGMHSGPLAAYAAQLILHAQAFAVRDLEKHLSEFPELVQTIEQRPPDKK